MARIDIAGFDSEVFMAYAEEKGILRTIIGERYGLTDEDAVKQVIIDLTLDKIGDIIYMYVIRTGLRDDFCAWVETKEGIAS